MLDLSVNGEQNEQKNTHIVTVTDSIIGPDRLIDCIKVYLINLF